MGKVKNKMTTDRLILRHWRTRDARELYGYSTDPLVGPSAGWPVHKSVFESRSIIAHGGLSTPQAYAIVLKETNKPIGSVGYIFNSELLKGEKEGELGYWIGRPYWNKGLMTEAVKEMLRHGFLDLDYETIWCGYYDGNIASKKVQEKCGFIYNYTIKDAECKLLDEIRTEHITKLTRKEWMDICTE